MLKEFKEFALKGNVVDMAVGIIVGAAFSPIVGSMVNDVLMPPIGLLVGGVDFRDSFVVLKEGAAAGPYATLEAAQRGGAVTLRHGMFINAVVNFVIVAFAVFLLVRAMNRLRRTEAPPPPPHDARDCPFCLSRIPLRATRCAHCTADVGPAA